MYILLIIIVKIIDPNDAKKGFFERYTIVIQAQMNISADTGARYSIIPTAVATPFPPRNPKKGENVLPINNAIEIK